MSSSPVQWHSSVQTRLCCLHEHLREHVLVGDAHLHRINCITSSGAGASLLSTGNSLPSCSCHPSCKGSRITGCRTRSCDQTLACTRARLMSINQSINFYSAPSSHLLLRSAPNTA